MLFVLCDLSIDILLQLSVLFAEVHVFQKFILCSLGFNKHFVGAWTLTVDVLQDFVIVTDLLLILCTNAVNSVNGRIGCELLKLLILAELRNIRVEHHVICCAESAFCVLIGLTLPDTVGQRPGSALLAIWAHFSPLLRCFERLVPTNIDEGLLLKEFLLVLTNKTLGCRFDTETSHWLDEGSARRQFTSLHQLIKVLIELWAVLWI